jgi:hypothetical protein
MHRKTRGDNAHHTNLAQILCLLVECVRADAKDTLIMPQDSL